MYRGRHGAIRLSNSARPMRTRRASAQDSNVFECQAQARARLRVIEVDEPHAYAALARIVPGTNESTNEARRNRANIR